MAVFSLGDRRVTFHSDDWYIAESASVIGAVSIGHQTSIWFNVVIRGDNDTITLGDGSNIQDGSVLHADAGIPLALGSHVTVGHNAMLHGCSVGDGTLIGINSVVLNRSVIGSGSIVGANTLVPEGKTFPDGVLVLGSPGKVVRELTDNERINVLRIAEDYVRRAKLFREELKPQPVASIHKRRSRR